MLGPFDTMSRLTPIHQMSLAVLSRAACASMSTTTATTTTCDRGDHGMGPITQYFRTTDLEVDALFATFGLHQIVEFASLSHHHVLLLVPQNTLFLLLFSFLPHHANKPQANS